MSKTVLVFNLPDAIGVQELESKCSTFGTLTRCRIKKSKGKSGISNGLITFLNSDDAQRAVREIKFLNEFPVSLKIFDKDVSKYKKFRIIVRNLPFEVTKSQLMDIFKKFGNINEIQLPQKFKKTCKGFAFVQYENFESAKHALESLNGTSIQGRTIAVDWALSKDRYAKITHPELQDSNKEIDMYHDVISKVQTKRHHSEQKIETKKLKKMVEEDKADVPRPSINKLIDDNIEEKQKNVLFVRNIPVDATQIEFENVFAQYGELIYALLVSLNGGKIHKGSGFVQFKRIEDAARCLEISLKNDHILTCPITKRDNDSTSHAAKEKNNVVVTRRNNLFKSRHEFLFGGSSSGDEEDLTKSKAIAGSLLKEDGTEERLASIQNLPIVGNFDKHGGSSDGGIFLHNQRLLVCYAVKRERLTEILKMKELYNRKNSNFDRKTIVESGISLNTEDDTFRQHQREKDKRNLYLLDESSIKKCSKRYGGELSQSDLNKRSKLMASNKNKLKLLHFFVSPTRLTVHNLPKWIDSRILKLLFNNAVNEPNAKILEARIMLDLSQAAINKSTKLGDKSVRKKISKVDAPSLCYGFVEFREPRHALKALKLIDNNPKAYQEYLSNLQGGAAKLLPDTRNLDLKNLEMRRPIVQFSISNRLALNAKQRRIDKDKLHKNTHKILIKPNPPEIKSLPTERKKKLISPHKTTHKIINPNPPEIKSLPTKRKKKLISATKRDRIKLKSTHLGDVEDEELVKDIKSIHKKIFGKIK